MLFDATYKEFFKLLNTYKTNVNDVEYFVVPNIICQPNKSRTKPASGS